MESFIAKTHYTPESKRKMQKSYEALMADEISPEDAEDYVTPVLDDLLYNPESGEWDIVETPDDIFNESMDQLNRMGSKQDDK